MRDSKFIEAYLKIINEGADDAAPEMNDEQGGDEAAEQAAPLKKVTFLTSDEALVNALNSGFEEVVFFVKSENDEGEESVEEVKIGADSFGSVEVADAEEEAIDECGDPTTGNSVDEGEDDGIEGESIDECGDAGTEGESIDEGEDDGIEGESIDECNSCDGCEPSEWIEDGVCLKCGSADCDGTCEGSDAFQKMAAEENGTQIDEFLDGNISIGSGNTASNKNNTKVASGNDVKQKVASDNDVKQKDVGNVSASDVLNGNDTAVEVDGAKGSLTGDSK